MLTIYATDFTYDGRQLSEWGFVICNFSEGGGAKAAGKGSEITFNMVPVGLGQRYAVTGARFNARLSAGFDICKDPERFDGEEMNIRNEEFRQLSRWLNRRQFLWFRAFDVCDPGTILPWFRATFTLSKIELYGEMVGIHLDMQTDSPFGYGDEIEESFHFTPESMTQIIEDKNEDIGNTWPEIVITCKEGGDLRIVNDMTGDVFLVKNCFVGEQLVQYGDVKIIESRRKIRNLLKLPGSENYVAGNRSKHGGYTYTVDNDGVITLS